MEILKELPGGLFHDRTTLNEKLKNKRQRSSPSAFSGGGGCSIYDHSSLVTWSSREDEDEDMDVANSLILLARGGGVDDKDAAKHNHHETARKFTEIPSTSSAKVGFYVYECKTCSRVFPSFQALGGHRASHKRPKLVAENNDHSEEQAVIISSKVETVVIASSPAKQQLLVNNDISNTSNNKVRECSICGAEFASGQALGGHMRRHRSSLSLTGKKECDDAKFTRNVFVLDLNMPAPLEATDDHKPHATLLTPPLVMLSGAKLVDCRY